MNRKNISIFAVFLVLLVSSAGVLVWFKSHCKLGPPGLKVVQVPILDPKGAVVGTNSVFLPLNVDQTESTPLPVTETEYNWLPQDTTYGRRRYLYKDGFSADISVVLMGTDRTSIHKPQYCLTGQGFTEQSEGDLPIQISQPKPYVLPTRKMVLNKEFTDANGNKIRGRAIFIYWYVSANHVTGNLGDMLWHMSRNLLMTGTLDRYGYVAVFTVVPPEAETIALERLKKLINDAVPEFQLTTVGASAP